MRSHTHTFIAPEQRLTSDMRKRLEQLAPLFYIHIQHKYIDGQRHVEFSGAGFSESKPVVLNATDATVRLLAEICSILTRWIPFSVWEPCEVTLFALAPERIERCAASFRKQITQAQRQAEREAAELTVRKAVSTIK
jgi:hypothetical protein